MNNRAADTNTSRRWVLGEDLAELLTTRSELDQLHITYQPIRTIRSRHLAGVEALLRWTHPTIGPVDANTTVELARTQHLGTTVDHIVLELVAADVAEHPTLQHVDHINVNICASTLNETDAANHILTTWATSNTPPSKLTLDINNRDQLTDAALHQISTLTDTGTRIAIDDPGTTTNTLWLLARTPVHELKLDTELTRQLRDPNLGRTVIEGITNLAHRLGINVVAEGIEDDTVEQIAHDAGITYGQGTLYGRDTHPTELDTLNTRADTNWTPAPTPDTEPERLRALEQLGEHNQHTADTIEQLAIAAADHCNTPISLVTLVDNDQQHHISVGGRNTTSTPRATSLCAHAIHAWETGDHDAFDNGVYHIENLRRDPRFAGNPAVTRHDIVMYAGAPLIVDNHAVGMLCLLDTRERTLTAQQQTLLRTFADAVAARLQLDAARNP